MGPRGLRLCSGWRDISTVRRMIRACIEGKQSRIEWPMAQPCVNGTQFGI